MRGRVLLRRNWHARLFLAFFLLTPGAIAFAGGADDLRQRVANIYGIEGGNRVQQWRELIAEVRTLAEVEQIERVNQFFNRMNARSDIAHWGSRDYWATPIELLGSNAGDCEDFSIAKYITLIELGIPDDRMRITYTRFLPRDQAHMVLTYYPTPESEPLVLDNVDPNIRAASTRSDLTPVFSFNGDGLWSNEPVGIDRRVGDASGLKPWRALRTRLAMSEVAVQ